MANKRIPTELKIVRGTDQPCRRKKEPEYEKLTVCPDHPEYLSNYARKMWKRLAPQLFEKGLLSAAYLPALEVLCEAYGLYREAHNAIYKQGNRRRSLAAYLQGKRTGEITEYRIMKAAFQDFRLYLLEFGLSPSSKGGIDSPKPVDTKDVIERMWNKQHG